MVAIITPNGMYEEKKIVMVNSDETRAMATTTIQAWINQCPIVAVDTETTGLQTLENELILVTIATPEVAFVVPKSQLSLYLVTLLRDTKVHKLTHCGVYDWSYIKNKLGHNMGPIKDTKRMAKALGLEHTSLSNLSQNLLNFTLPKALATSFDSELFLSDDQIVYAALDALILFPLYFSLCNSATLDIDTETAQVRLDDLVPYGLYLKGMGPWPKHGYYPSLEHVQPCAACGNNHSYTGFVHCAPCLKSLDLQP